MVQSPMVGQVGITTFFCVFLIILGFVYVLSRHILSKVEHNQCFTKHPSHPRSGIYRTPAPLYYLVAIHIQNNFLFPDGTGKLLWEFLSELLNDPTHQSDPKPIVRWIDMPTYTFQILDTGRLSSLWGQQKNRGTMNYEKLSRALRYYKKVGIIEKAAGKRLTYKYVSSSSHW